MPRHPATRSPPGRPNLVRAGSHRILKKATAPPKPFNRSNSLKNVFAGASGRPFDERFEKRYSRQSMASQVLEDKEEWEEVRRRQQPSLQRSSAANTSTGSRPTYRKAMSQRILGSLNDEMASQSPTPPKTTVPPPLNRRQHLRRTNSLESVWSTSKRRLLAERQQGTQSSTVTAKRVVEDDEQWSKFLEAVRSKRALTSISLVQELGDLMQDRATDMPRKPKARPKGFSSMTQDLYSYSASSSSTGSQHSRSSTTSSSSRGGGLVRKLSRRRLSDVSQKSQESSSPTSIWDIQVVDKRRNRLRTRSEDEHSFDSAESFWGMQSME